jgi:hypothetical protein
LAERRSKIKGYCRLVGRSAGVRRSKIRESAGVRRSKTKEYRERKNTVGVDKSKNERIPPHVPFPLEQHLDA